MEQTTKGENMKTEIANHTVSIFADGEITVFGDLIQRWRGKVVQTANGTRLVARKNHLAIELPSKIYALSCTGSSAAGNPGRDAFDGDIVEAIIEAIAKVAS